MLVGAGTDQEETVSSEKKQVSVDKSAKQSGKGFMDDQSVGVAKVAKKSVATNLR